jgi:hypothetical protein
VEQAAEKSILTYDGLNEMRPEKSSMYVCKEWAITPAPAPRPSTIYCAKEILNNEELNNLYTSENIVILNNDEN